MAERTVVEWQSSYSVGMRLVDEQHQELIKLTNMLFMNCLEDHQKARAAFLQTIRKAVDYVGYHFHTEEKIMERVAYPDFTLHKEQHASFVRTVITKVDEFNAGKPRAALTFVYFLKDWVLNHIAVSDKKMGNYVLALSRSGELQKMTVQVKKDKAAARIEIR